MRPLRSTGFSGDRRGMTLVEVLVTLSLLAVLAVPLHRFFLVSFQATRLSAVAVEATQEAATVAARIRSAGSRDLAGIPSLDRDYEIVALSDTQFRLSPRERRGAGVVDVRIAPAAGSPFYRPGAGFDLLEDDLLRGRSSGLYLVRVRVEHGDSPAAIHHTSIVE